MKKRCYLCGGKLAGNICTECGLDNSKTDESYVMGKSGCEELLTHVHTEYEEQLEKKTLTKEEQRRLKEQIRRRTQTQKEAKKPQGQVRTAYSSSEMHQGKKAGKGKGALIGTIVAIAMVAVPLISDIYEEVFETKTWGFEENSGYEEAAGEYYDPYSGVTRELLEEGEQYEITLEAGVYKGGVHIPEGSYYVEPDGNNGSVELEDVENNIYVTYSFDREDESAVDSIEDFRIYKGGIITIEGRVSVYFRTENAQMELTWMPNPNTESKTLSDQFTAGVDIPAGVYDVECIEGFGIFDYEIERNSGDFYYEGKLIGAGDSMFAGSYKNIVLPEGTEVTIKDMTVTLTPSEYIESEDYNNFYPEY